MIQGFFFAKHQDKKDKAQVIPTAIENAKYSMMRGTTILILGQENCKERLYGIIYWKEGGLSECSKRPITICGGRFDLGRLGTYATIT